MVFQNRLGVEAVKRFGLRDGGIWVMESHFGAFGPVCLRPGTPTPKPRILSQTVSSKPSEAMEPGTCLLPRPSSPSIQVSPQSSFFPAERVRLGDLGFRGSGLAV